MFVQGYTHKELKQLAYLSFPYDPLMDLYQVHALRPLYDRSAKFRYELITTQFNVKVPSSPEGDQDRFPYPEW